MTTIQYYRGTECKMDVLFTAFQTGFSDYLIKYNFTLEQFADRFFGPEGNAIEHSFVALRGDEPVGIVLGGTREYEGIRTMRCGALALKPGERGQGVSARLMELHREEAIRQGCRQLLLEVIVGNDRAIAFYHKLGYSRVYELSYFSKSDLSNLKSLPNKLDDPISVAPLDWGDFASSVNKNRYFHLNWQNDLDYIRRAGDHVFFGAFHEGELVGTLGITRTGRISILFVDLDFRSRGTATRLLQRAVSELELSKLSISMPNNALIEGFIRRLGFQRDAISQYEMYLTL
ncbi:GNAT family N-acetyltransferase [Paenibacillus sp. Marseille-P2973]|uniref:GNAT family N-acetyltransferase n=1 Tax=Paenibacillus TaxID=44249 RepID=UPI001B381F7C|nr:MULTISPECIES: GNAT family N-acetyltransferase [Paenibacillus]MBQ4899685.1 GNAT family N-acetyltransferase [Paenibacillus sp. Marseille-P2973]MDN4069641.1 GNAT family N-acetyltransferase [Paenibacillus vini]